MMDPRADGGIRSTDMIFIADKIDLKSLDLHLEKHLSRVWSRHKDVQKPKAEWEIDFLKLDISNVIAHRTYGTVYRGVYDGQDAGKSAEWVNERKETYFLKAWSIIFYSS